MPARGENGGASLVQHMQKRSRDGTSHAGENMCTNDRVARDDVNSLQTRLVILEAALAWIRHESRSAARGDVEGGRRAMERIESLASQVLDDDELALLRLRRRIAVEHRGVQQTAS
jgi:hypothetical protein